MTNKICTQRTIRSQLLIVFLLFTIIAIGCILWVCLELSILESNNAYKYASDSMYRINVENIQSTSRALSDAVSESLQVYVDFALSSALLESLILNPSQVLLLLGNSLPSPKIISEPLYREYNFVNGCQYPKCPQDFGPLTRRSRASMLSNTNGSMEQSSLQLFSSSTNAARNDSSWNRIVSSDTNIQIMINSLGIFDDEFNVIYHDAVPTSVLLYVAASLIYSDDKYVNMFVSYPGAAKSNVAFDVWKREWFKEAPIDAVHMYGPYEDYFTKDKEFTISSKREIVLAKDMKVVIVCAVDNLLSAFEEIIHGQDYPSDGFGAVIKADGSNEVLVWKEGIDIYNEATSSFKTVQDLDPNLAQYNLTQNQVIQYHDSDGEEWLVSCTPFFNSTSYGVKETKYSFVILVWVKYSVASKPLTDLKHKTNQSFNGILLINVVVATAVGILIFIIVFSNARRLNLIDNIVVICKQLIELQGLEASDRNYTATLALAARLPGDRRDEVGLLASEFLSVVLMLNRENSARRDLPENPVNPFYLPFNWGVNLAPNGPAALYSSLWSYVLKHHSESRTVGPEERAPVKMERVAEQLQEQQSPNVADTPAAVHWLQSFKTPLYLAVVLLLAGIATAMIYTVITMSSSGQTWMTSTSNNIDLQITENLEVIVSAKSTVIELFFQKMTVLTMLGGNYTTKLMAGNLTLPNWNENGDYLQSYSLDPLNNFSYPLPSTMFSGYYMTESANCFKKSSCQLYQNLPITKLTSLLDLKYLSYTYNTSVVSNVQFAVQNSSFTRIAPYFHHPYSNESTCIISDQTFEFCAKRFAASRCSDPSYPTYPNYDARCRSYYHVGYDGGDTSKVYFSNPYYTATNPSLQIAATVPFKTRPGGSIDGVVAYNVDVSVVTDAINSITILTHGYCYVISRSNTSIAIVHPNLQQKPQCKGSLACLEGSFSQTEYQSFYTNVLLPLQSVGYAETKQYLKGGRLWRLAYKEVKYGTVDYILIATVPESDIEATSTTVNKNIDRAVETMVIILTIVGFILVLIIIFVSKKVVDRVLSPLEMLRELCRAIMRDELAFNIPFEASSKDMKVLLESFSGLLISIRFSRISPDDIRDYPETCKEIFQEALEIFDNTGNKWGVGVCLNNLGSAYLSNSDLPRASDCFNRSIIIADELLRAARQEDERRNLYKILSDRKYNLALVLIERGLCREACELLVNGRAEDRNCGYSRGLISKQLALGQLYLNRREVTPAFELFSFPLLATDQIAHMSATEVMIARQMALRHLGFYYESTRDIQAAEVHYLRALCEFQLMHVGTTKKVIFALMKMWSRDPSKVDRVRDLVRLASRLKFNIGDARTIGSILPKRVVFVMDYSFTMIGAKIQTAVRSLKDLYERCIYDEDSCALFVFSDNVVEVVRMNTKRADGENMRRAIIGLTSPDGGTALIYAITTAVQILEEADIDRDNKNDWVVVLTDGVDSTRADPSRLTALLSESTVGLIIIGVGEDVDEDALLELCQAAGEQRGHYLRASADLKSIQTAFNRVGEILQSDVIFQTMY